MTRTIHIDASAPYDVTVGNGILADIGNAVKDCLGCSRVALFTDDTVDRLYSGTVTESLQRAGIDCCSFVFTHGETEKDIATVTDFIRFMAGKGITRSDAVLALGGGVAGDMAGLSAALYMRGIRFVQIPTTLLAMVDSSVGGKTAVNIPEGKNLIGAFHQPAMVWCDTDTLKTLPRDILRDGYAEVIKYGVLFDNLFFRELSLNSNIIDIVTKSVTFKQNVVEADEKDHGQRALLNFGHTIGHALEKLSGYSITHGEAVAAGMIRAALMGAAYGLADCSREIASKVREFGFRTGYPYSASDIFNAAMTDKKSNGKGITMIFPVTIGKCGLYDIDSDTLQKLLIQTEQWI